MSPRIGHYGFIRCKSHVSSIHSAPAAPQPLVALPSFLFVDTFFQLLPLALGFAAGCMLWMVFAELLPDALNDAKHSKVGAGWAAASWAWLVQSGLHVWLLMSGTSMAGTVQSLAT